MRHIVRGASCVLLLLVTSVAAAQAPPVIAAPPPLASTQGEPTAGAAGTSYALIAPLHLSLTGVYAPSSGAMGDGACASREDASGNSVNGVPIQRYGFVRLSERLVLHGFSRAGCPLDAGLGGAVSLTLLALPSIGGSTTSLVASAGAFALPNLTPRRIVTTSEARLDLVHRAPAASTSLGVGVRRGATPTVTFGGRF